VPIFRGNILDGDEYIRMVKTPFRSNAMSQFLENPSHCNNSPYWSGAFASRLRETIKENDILSFLATELDRKNNCARVWTRIKKRLSSTDTKTARVMTNWISLLMSKCDNRDSFLSFYSKTKGILHKLDKDNSIAAKDNIFLKACLSIAFEATELQMEVKGFLCDTNITYSEILELIHAYFKIQKTSKHLRDTTMRSGSTAIVRRDKPDNEVNLKNTDTPLKTTGSFPNNHGKILPSDYCRQLREWYEVLSASKSDRTPEQVTWVEHFNFIFDVAQHGMWPHKNQCNDTRHDGSFRQNWNAGGGGQNDLRNRGWDQGRAEYRGITAMIVEVTKVTGITVVILPLAVG